MVNVTEPDDTTGPLSDDLDLEAEVDETAFDETDEIQASSAVGKFRRNTGAGLMLNGVALGLAEIYDPVVKEDPPIVQEESDVPFDRDVDAILDPDDPAASVVTFRNGSGAGTQS